jgi:hypothetical protein
MHIDRHGGQLQAAPATPAALDPGHVLKMAVAALHGLFTTAV